MGEALLLPRPEFNRSVIIEARPERLTAESGAIALREAAHQLGVFEWLDERLDDPRDPDLITHPLRELLMTYTSLLALGWRDQSDANTLRDDPAMRLAVSTRRGVAPLLPPDPDADEPVPDGLASQSTLSRLVVGLSPADNRAALRESLCVTAGRRIRAMNRGHRHASVTLDVDSLPVEVHGHQEGSAYHGYYRQTMYHPLVAVIGETGDIVDVQLRPGNSHSATGALDFVLPLLDRVEREIGVVASVRIDAGFPGEELLRGLEERRLPVGYVARLKNNAVLDRMAEPHLQVPLCAADDEPEMWLHEMTYRAGSWSRARRVVLIVLQRPGELFPRHFWLLSNWSAQQVSGHELLDLYRRRGKAEGHFGELMSTLQPALSSTRRPKSHYRGEVPDKRTASRDPFAANEVLLLLNALAYQLMHAIRGLVERATRRGWSLQRIRERVLRVPARVLLHARRATLVIGQASAALWQRVWKQLPRLSTGVPLPGAT